MTGIAVLGAGAFGTALATVLGRDRPVRLWARDPDHAAAMRTAGVNARHLPDQPLSGGVDVTARIAEVTEEIALIAVPTQQLDGFLRDLAPGLRAGTLVLCCKGVHRATGLRPSQLVARHCPKAGIAVLTGPSFASDIAAGLPTALTLAADRDGVQLQSRLSTPTLRLYLTDDLTGAELGGALKNVMALAAGLTVGAGLGDSARASIVTRGFAEMVRFATAAGARAETLSGLSGLGDLILTCTSPKSRNFSAGVRIGRGQTPTAGQTIEGLETARAVSHQARQLGIDMPLTDVVAAVTGGKMALDAAVDHLMSRPLKKE